MWAACSWSSVLFPCSELSSRLIVAPQSLRTCSSDVLLPFYIIAFLSRFLLESCIQQHLAFGIMPALCNFGGRPRVTGPPSTSACMGVLRTGARIGGHPPLALLPLQPCALRIIDIMLSHLRPHLGRDSCGCGQWSFWVEVLVSLRTTPPSMALPAPLCALPLANNPGKPDRWLASFAVTMLGPCPYMPPLLASSAATQRVPELLGANFRFGVALGFALCLPQISVFFLQDCRALGRGLRPLLLQHPKLLQPQRQMCAELVCLAAQVTTTLWK